MFLERRVQTMIDYVELSRDELMELVVRRRRQLHVHSVAYYHLDQSFVDDATFDLWSKELADIQQAFPELANQGVKADLFKGWTGETGMHLPITDDALRVINSLKRREV